MNVNQWQMEAATFIHISLIFSLVSIVQTHLHIENERMKWHCITNTKQRHLHLFFPFYFGLPKNYHIEHSRLLWNICLVVCAVYFD